MSMSTDKPEIACVCCEKPLETRLQAGKGYYPDFWFVTCLTEGCPLQGYTLSAAAYPPANLELYLQPTEGASPMSQSGELVTTREEDVRAICEQAKFTVRAVELTATRVIVTVAEDRRHPTTLIKALYRAMADLKTAEYGVSYHNELLRGVTELWFGAQP